MQQFKNELLLVYFSIENTNEVAAYKIVVDVAVLNPGQQFFKNFTFVIIDLEQCIHFIFLLFIFK